MNHHSNKLEDFAFHDSEITSCILEGDILKMDVRMLNVHKDIIEGYDTDMQLEGAKIVFRGFRLLRVEKEAEQTIYPNGEWSHFPNEVYEGIEAEVLFWAHMSGTFWVNCLAADASGYVLTGNEYARHEVVDIYFQFDEVEISWDSFLCPAWYEQRR